MADYGGKLRGIGREPSPVGGCGGGSGENLPKVDLDGNDNLTVQVGTLKVENGQDGNMAIYGTTRCMDPNYAEHKQETLDTVGKLCNPSLNIPIDQSPVVKALSDSALEGKLQTFCDGAQKMDSRIHKGAGNTVKPIAPSP